MHAAYRLVSLGLISVFMMPTLKLVDDHDRTHRRHATCEHHLRHHHPDPADRARVLRRAARRAQRQRELELARLAQAQRSLAPPPGDDADGVPIQAAADPFDDDSSMKKKHRKGSTDGTPWLLKEPARVRLAGEFLAKLRLHLDTRGNRLQRESEPFCHFGSGPCHDIPRPREGTIILTRTNDVLAA